MIPQIPASSRRFAALLLAAMLLLLAFRLTATETLRDTLAQTTARLAATPDAPRGPFVGPAFTAAYAALSLSIAGMAAILAARAGALTRRHLIHLGLVTLTIILLTGSTLRAANRFHGLVGTLDLASALAAGWAVVLLCHDRLLGPSGRNSVIAAIAAILAMGLARACHQYFIDYPDLLQFVRDNREEALSSQGILGDPVQERLFLSRLNSREVTGFGPFANAFATHVVALVTLLTAFLIASYPLLRKDRRPTPRPLAGTGKPRIPTYSNQKQQIEIPLHLLALIFAAILLLAAVPVLLWTHSNGGIASALLAVPLAAGVTLFPRQLYRWRKPLLVGVILATLLAAAAIMAYGKTYDRLPSRSLNFRWQYWTAAESIVRQHPVWGVGLNNFGDYYLAFKRPSSPEDVKDPHSFFVRLASETGIPATLAVGGLILFLVASGLRSCAQSKVRSSAYAVSLHPSHPTTPQPDHPESASPPPSPAPPLLLAAAVTLLWIPFHLFLAQDVHVYNAIFTGFYAILGYLTFAGVYYPRHLLTIHQSPAAVPHPSPRFFTEPLLPAALIAALAMLLYDQVNMALVTGPAAMLFWILLALPASAESPAIGRSALRRNGTGILLSIPLLGSAMVAVWLAFSIARQTFPWDPAPLEAQYIRRVISGDSSGALESLDAAIERAPRAIEYRLQRILLKRERLHQPVAQDTREVLSLDRANAKPRLMLALPDSDLPAVERMAILKDALRFDSLLEPDEPKRLSSEQIRAVEEALSRLQGQ